jgi:hypothetical protein
MPIKHTMELHQNLIHEEIIGKKCQKKTQMINQCLAPHVIDAFVGRTYQRRPKSVQLQTQEIRTPTQDN